MHKEEKKKNRAAIALTLCFCVMALTSVFAVKASLDKIQSTLDPAKATQDETDSQQNTEAAAKTPVVDSEGSSTESDNNAGSSSQSSAPYINPVDGTVQLKYSMDALVYSKTLDQYMTHSGVDISADLSSKVKAIAAGTVTKVYNDDRYGITVQITHENGIISTYSNLAKQGLAETGDVVKQGQTIGCIGKTALFESQEESHLHLEIIEDNACRNPCDYIKDLS